jgi:hypothetical protein
MALNPDGLNRILVGLIDRFQRQMLVDLQALFAFVPGNQLSIAARHDRIKPDGVASRFGPSRTPRSYKRLIFLTMPDDDISALEVGAAGVATV